MQRQPESAAKLADSQPVVDAVQPGVPISAEQFAERLGRTGQGRPVHQKRGASRGCAVAKSPAGWLVRGRVPDRTLRDAIRGCTEHSLPRASLSVGGPEHYAFN